MDGHDLKLLGPLEFLAGRWQGKKGRNIAPNPERGIEDGHYTEEIIFTPIGVVRNHEETLYGLRYSTTAFENGQEAFHEEVGYWLYQPERQEIYRIFIVPRGVQVLAGGKLKENGCDFFLEAKLGDELFGISTTPFLHKEFKTVRYTLDFKKISSTEFFYKQMTYMEMPNRNSLFEHLDENHMVKISHK